jgi:hypothetical protein
MLILHEKKMRIKKCLCKCYLSTWKEDENKEMIVLLLHEKIMK